MKIPSFKIGFAVVTGGVLLAGCLSAMAQGSILYDNTTTDLHTRFDPGTTEVGDEIMLATQYPSTVTSFSFQYWGTSFTGSETARLRFYANDGAAYGTTPMPGSLLFDSGAFPISATDRSVLTFTTDFGAGVTVPAQFTYTVQFGGLGAGANAGVDLYGPPTVGNNFTDYWAKNGNSWELRSGAGGASMDFGARLVAVPEPGTYALGGLGLALLFYARSRFSKK